MNLFNYLMNKNNKKLVDNDHMLEYLLNNAKLTTIEGTELNITAKKTKINELIMTKESTQDGSPTPDNPIEVKTVKDNVEITITDNTNVRNYTILLGNNEIAGIGDYKDELIIDKQGHCYLNKKIGKVVFNGSENWFSGGNHEFRNVISGMANNSPLLCSHYENNSSTLSDAIYTYYNTFIRVINTSISSTTDFKTWLSSNNITVYYVLAEPTLIDLNYTVDLTLYKGNNTLTNSEDMTMLLKYYS